MITLGKQDENALRKQTATTQSNLQQQTNSGISSAQPQLNTAIGNTQSDRQALLSSMGTQSGNKPTTPTSGPVGGGSFADQVNALYAKYGKSDTGAGSGITDANYWANTALANAGGDQQYVLNRLESDLKGTGPDQGGGGSGGASAMGMPSPDYLNTFNEISSSPTGGFDPTRLSNITSDANNLRNASSQYGSTNKSISGLQDFASTGGVDPTLANQIVNPTLQEFSQTGGYSPTDIANIRARSNAGIADTYQNMQDQLTRQKVASGNMSPGFSAAGFRLARQGAQDIGTQAQGTEANLASMIQSGRLSAAGALSSAAQGLAGLKSSNTLSGYTNAGNLDLSKQGQIENATAAAGGLDLNTQQLINQSRLAATSGLSQDALGRGALANQLYGINTQANTAANALNEQKNEFGVSAGQNLLGLDQNTVNNINNLLLNYRNSNAQQQLGILNGPMTTLANSPGLLDRITSGIGAATGLAGPITSGIKYLNNPLSAAGSGFGDPIG